MRARKFVTSFGNVASLLLLLVIWSALPRVTVGAENNPAATSDTAPSANISSETVRNYIDWITQEIGWTPADVPPIKITSFAHLRELSGLSNDAEWIRPAAFYSRSEHLIYLADNWNKDDLVDQSILVHELVHHLQLEDHIQFACWVLLKCNKISAAVDNGKSMIPAVFLAFRRSAGDRRFCLLKRNRHAISRRRWRRRGRLLLCVNGTPKH